MTLERTCYSRAACPGGPVALVPSVRGTGNTPTACLLGRRAYAQCFFHDQLHVRLLLGEEGSFALVRRLRRVGPDLKTALMPMSQHAFLILSLTPATYGRKATGALLCFVVVFVARLSRCSTYCC